MDKRERYELWREPDRVVLAALSGFTEPVQLSDIAQFFGFDDEREGFELLSQALRRLRASGLIHSYAPEVEPGRNRGPRDCVRWGLAEEVALG